MDFEGKLFLFSVVGKTVVSPLKILEPFLQTLQIVTFQEEDCVGQTVN